MIVVLAVLAISFAVLAILLAAAPASARTRPNVPGATMLGPDGPRLAGRAAFGVLASSPPSITAIPVPLPVGAERVDSTYYDLQDMGSLGARIVTDLMGTGHVTYQKDFCEIAGSCPPNPGAADPFPWRGMGYAYRSGGVWTRLGKVQDPRLNCPQCVPEHLGGFGTIARSPSGAIAISQHMNEDGCERRGDMYLEDSPGSASWSGYLTPILQSPPDPDYLEFPQIAANSNGSYTLLAESPRAGLYDEVKAFRVSYLPAPGARFSCPLGWQFGAWKDIAPVTLFRDSLPAFPSIAASSNGRVGVAVGDFGGNVYLIESSNGSFASGTVTTRNLTSYLDASITASDSTSTQYRPYIHCHLAYNDTTPHVVWSEIQARRVSGHLEYFAYRPRIVHWDPIRGREVVKQVAAGEADRYDDVDQGLAGPLAGQNTLAVDWPQVGFSSDGSEIYVAWLRFSDAEVDPTANMGLPGVVTGVGFGDIAASLTRPGEGWSPAQNLTNTPSTDERFFSIAPRNTGGKVHVVFQASATNQAGDAILGDRGTNPGVLLRRIAYLERTLTSSLVSVPDGAPQLLASSVLATPNPAASRVRFARPAGFASRAGETLEIFSVEGRRIARVAASGDGTFMWDGRAAGGPRAMAGLYFARVAGDAGARATRFTLLP
jgi:hypothetical protein